MDDFIESKKCRHTSTQAKEKSLNVLFSLLKDIIHFLLETIGTSIFCNDSKDYFLINSDIFFYFFNYYAYFYRLDLVIKHASKLT